MINLKVELGSRTYPVFIGQGILSKLGEMLRMYDLHHQVSVISDANVLRRYEDHIMESVGSYAEQVMLTKVPGGEKAKSLQTANKIITAMLEQGFDRNAVVVAFGGGAVGDVSGFVASIYKRGIRYVQVPTTLLAQVDASIGGKTGINHTVGKNLIGTFHQPSLVWSDLSLLQTLPKREMISGLAEIIKYGIIQDEPLFSTVENHLEALLSLDMTLLPEVVKICCEIKIGIVAEDEMEAGRRMVLNFGHTIGHALEAASGYKKLSHGEAVLLGMLAESKMANASKLLANQTFDRIRKLVAKFNLRNKIDRADFEQIRHLMQNDKKKSDGKLRFILPEKIGKVCVVQNVRDDLIDSGVLELSG